jgi:hypothetical protein
MLDKAACFGTEAHPEAAAVAPATGRINSKSEMWRRDPAPQGDC